jgi:hypothetical protein
MLQASSWHCFADIDGQLEYKPTFEKQPKNKSVLFDIHCHSDNAFVYMQS